MSEWKHMNVDIGLRAFTDGVETYIAYSAEDAFRCQYDLIGENPDDENFFEEVAHNNILSINDENFEPRQTITKTCAEWCESNGRGFLCSTEW